MLGLPGEISYSGAGLTGTRTPDEAGRLEMIEWKITSQNNAIVSSHLYTLDAAGKRTAAAREDGTHWDYGYNSKGEVTSAVHENAANQELPGRTFGYEFDDIGNRKTATHKVLGGAVQSTGYTANGLNQYEIIAHPHPLRKLIQGLAHEQADITVSPCQSAHRPAVSLSPRLRVSWQPASR